MNNTKKTEIILNNKLYTVELIAEKEDPMEQIEKLSKKKTMKTFFLDDKLDFEK